MDKEKENKHSWTFELPPQVIKIATYRDYYKFIGIGKNFLWLYDASTKDIKERKEQIISQKYLIQNNFVDLSFFPDSDVFVVISAERNVFIIQDT